jgi:hypothetical protein
MCFVIALPSGETTYQPNLSWPLLSPGLRSGLIPKYSKSPASV